MVQFLGIVIISSSNIVIIRLIMLLLLLLLTLSAHAREGYCNHFVCVCVIQQRISKMTAFLALNRDREICKVSPFNVLELFCFDLVFKKKLVDFSRST